MKITFFVSSVGDANLALNTIKSMEQNGPHETLLIALTPSVARHINAFQSSSLIQKTTLAELLNIEDFSAECCTQEQLNTIIESIKKQQINHAYIGVPSVSNEIPFQIAQALEDTPVLMAYEFMYKPEGHRLWHYVPNLKQKHHIQWGLPLADAVADFEINDASKVHITGHLSIDQAYSSRMTRPTEEIKTELQVEPSQTLAFVSSTTQPVITDCTFLDCLLTELPQHPHVQVRFGLHPGIQDLDAYIDAILTVYVKHPDTHHQFKMIVPDALSTRFKTPELSINHALLQHAFLRININGDEAAFAADKVAQALPGALLNQAVIEGKPAYTHEGKPYLPKPYFSNSLSAFFSTSRQAMREKSELGLSEKSTAENYASILLGLVY